MREILRKLQKNNRKGFTLAELLIVIAITGILASFGFVEVAKAQRKLKRTEMDNTAREIFVAAQNHLTSSQTNGTWDASYIKTDGSVNIKTSDWQNTVDYTFTDYADDTSVYTTAQKDTKTHAFYYVIYNKTTYAEALTNSNSVLRQLLPYGSIDDTARSEGSYVIEFDAKTESVYGVFYTDKGIITKADLDGLNNLRGDTNTSAREQYSLKDASGKNITTAIGYYGGAKAYKNETKHMTSPSVQIFNDGIDTEGKTASDTNVKSTALEAVITDPNYSGDMKTSLSVTIKQKNGVSNLKTLPSVRFDINYIDGKMTVSNILPATDAVGIANVITVKTMTGSGIQYYISLDDIAEESKQFKTLFPNFTAGADIEVAATISYSGKASVHDAKIANSLFDSITDVDGNNVLSTSQTGSYSANIRSARHLQNLSQSISGYLKKDNQVTFELLSATLKNDIIWSNYYSTNFVPLSNSKLKYFDGQNHSLKNFNVDVDSGTGGLFSTISSDSMTINDLDLVDFSVLAPGSAGTLFGEVNKTANITNVHVYNSSTSTYGSADANGKYGVKSSGYCAGGLVGTINNNPTVLIESSSASVHVEAPLSDTGHMSAGGFIGYIYGESGSVTIDQCYVGGNVTSDTDDGANITGHYAGGFVCFTTGIPTEIRNCYTTATVAGSNVTGGFIGVVHGDADLVKVSNVYVENIVRGSNANGLFVGQVIASGGLDVQDNCYVLTGLSDSSIKNIDSSSTGSITGDDKINAVYSENLKTIASSSLASASPYLESLGEIFPYPCTKKADGTLIKHYGDWYKKSDVGVFTKTIYLSGSNSEAEYNYIKDNIYFEIHEYGVLYDYVLRTFTMNDLAVVKTNSGYTGTYPLDGLDPGYYYIREVTTDGFENQFSSYSIGNEGKTSFGNSYYQWTSNYTDSINGTPSSLSDDNSGFGFDWPTVVTYYAQHKYTLNNDTCLIPIVDASQKTSVSFSDVYNYKNNKSGLLYYEKTGTNYNFHGYSDSVNTYNNSLVETAVGSSSDFKVQAGLTVDDDGYILAIGDTYFYNDSNFADNVAVRLGYYSYNEASLSELTKEGGPLTEITDYATIKALGLVGNHVYKCNFTHEMSHNVWISDKISIYLKYKNNIIGNYQMNPYFADTVKKSTYSNTLNNVKIRSSRQLYRLMKDNGSSYFGAGTSVTMNQELDIDMSKYTDLLPIDSMSSSVYKGVDIQDGTTTRPTKLTLGNTFIKYITSGASIKHLQVSSKITSATSAQDILNASDYDGMNMYYGSFVDKTDYTFNDVEFVNCSFDGVTIGSTAKRYKAVGIIGYINNNISNISVDNFEISNIRAYTDNLSVFGDNMDATENITLTNIKIHDSKVIAGDTSLTDDISYATNSFTGLIKQITDWNSNNKMSNVTINGAQIYNMSTNSYTTGLVGYVFGQVSDLTVSDAHVYNTITTGTDIPTINSKLCGLIGYVHPSKTIDGLTVVAATTGGYGFDMHDLKLNSDFWGVIALNKGTIENSNISNVRIQNVNSADAMRTTENSYDYGVTGRNAGTITSSKFDSITISGITVPEQGGLVTLGAVGSNIGTISDTDFNNVEINTIDLSNYTALTKIYIGVIGANFTNASGAGSISNFGMNSDAISDVITFDSTKVKVFNTDTQTIIGKLNNDNSYNLINYNFIGAIGYNSGMIDNKGTTHTINDIQITGIYEKGTTTNTAFKYYGFVASNQYYVNPQNTKVGGSISNMSINQFVSDGYGFTVDNKASISKIIVGTSSNNKKATVKYSFFACYNAGDISSCSLYVKSINNNSNKKFIYYSDSTGTCTSCLLNNKAAN